MEQAAVGIGETLLRSNGERLRIFIERLSVLFSVSKGVSALSEGKRNSPVALGDCGLAAPLFLLL
jgi:hypothetical protein